MKIRFWKMHGAGNDFLLIDDRDDSFPIEDQAFVAWLCQRQTGVGSDGVILVQLSPDANFRMRFLNPDGQEVEMCGNGARCVARLACELAAAPPRMSIATVAGILQAEVRDEGLVQLWMTEPHTWTVGGEFVIGGQKRRYDAVNSGVPHVMVEVDDLAGTDVAAWGREVRYHPNFAPAGTNANFVTVEPSNTIRLRTYERGVEAETLACGTGMVACAVLAGRRGLVQSPVTLECASGDRLQVGFDLTADGARHVTLLGPAVHVYRGELEYER